jgi:hypothetical protein
MTDLIKASYVLTSDSHINEMAMVMFNEWVRVDPDSNVAKNPASYMANFADMARAVDRAYRQARESADGVKVKPLVWEAISDTSFRAKALMFGNVRVETYGAPWVINWSAPGYCDTLIAGEFDTPEAAKAAAQAYYEARIKAALDPQ